jgi:hypothetical protein
MWLDIDVARHHHVLCRRRPTFGAADGGPVLDRIAALALAAITTIATLTIGESATLANTGVERTSLLGYTVNGITWEADDAARALAFAAQAQETAARIAAAKASARANDPRPRVGGDLVRAPHRTIGGMSETWRAGAACEARLRDLRASAVGAYVTQTTRRGRGFLASRVEVEITYPAGGTVPAIETREPAVTS